MKKIMKMQLMAIALLSSGNIVQAMEEEQSITIEETQILGDAEDIATFWDSKQNNIVVSKKVVELSKFVMDTVSNTGNEQLLRIIRVMAQDAGKFFANVMRRDREQIQAGTMSVPEPQLSTVLATYFFTLLRNQNPYENTAIDVYSPSRQKELETEVFGRQTWGQWFTSWFKGGRNVYCSMFEQYVKPLLSQALPDDESVQQDYQHFLAQLFILAQQDSSGKCWDDAIAFLMHQSGFAMQETGYFLEAMAKSALINYATLYQMNQAAGALQSKYRTFMSLMTSWRYLYFLVTAAQALKSVDNDVYERFVKRNNLVAFLRGAGITKDNIALGSSLKSAIENPTFIQRSKSYLARVSKTKIGILGAAGLVTLGWNYRAILKDFGNRAWAMLSKTGSGFMTTAKGYYQQASKYPEQGVKRFQKFIKEKMGR